MGLRFEVLLYAQLLGLVFLACQYEYNVIFSRSNTQVDAIEKLKNFFSHNVSASGFVSIYIGAIICILTVINLKRVYTNRTPLDFFSVSLGLAGSMWFNSHYISQERILNYIDNEEVIQHIAKLTINTTIAGFFIFSILVLSLLASHVDFLSDPIELIFLNFLGGFVVLDLSFDFGFLINNSQEEHFLNITGISGCTLIEFIIPAILVFILVMTLFRITQHHFENFLTLIIVVGGIALFQYYVYPIEKTLDSPSYDSQKIIVYSHFVFAALIIFETAFKWTLYCLHQKPETPKKVVETPPVKGKPKEKTPVVENKNKKKTFGKK